MRRSYLYDFATLPAAVAVAMGAACLITAFAHLLNQLHGTLDVAWALSCVWAMRRHDERKQDRREREAAPELDYAADYERTMRSFGDATRGSIKEPRDDRRDGQTA